MLDESSHWTQTSSVERIWAPRSSLNLATATGAVREHNDLLWYLIPQLLLSSFHHFWSCLLSFLAPHPNLYLLHIPTDNNNSVCILFHQDLVVSYVFNVKCSWSHRNTWATSQNVLTLSQILTWDCLRSCKPTLNAKSHIWCRSNRWNVCVSPTPSKSITPVRYFAQYLPPSMVELTVSTADCPHFRAQASCDDPVNSSLGTPPPSWFTAEGPGSLHQQGHKDELAKEEG